MRPIKSLLIAMPAALLLGGVAFAQTTQSYTDTTGDIDSSFGSQPHLDITSVDVTAANDLSTITLKINLSGSPLDSPDGTNWGKYLVGIRSAAGGTTTSNGWTRPISMDGGMTHWIGTWADAGANACGGQIWTYSGGSWSETSAPTVTKDATGITIVFVPADAGLTAGETFSFDVYSSGGGTPDSAVDALSAAAASTTGWAGPYATGVVGGTNGALEFTMPGTSDFATWITGFGLAVADQDPGDDPDGDTLTNQQEFDAGLDLNPNDSDTDADGLDDNVETATGTYVDSGNTGTYPAIDDSDGDGHLDGAEVAGTALGFVSDPNVRNFSNISVAGSFTEPPWVADGSTNDTDMSRTADTDLIGQYGWTLDYQFNDLGAFNHKFTGDHSWTYNWGVGGVNGGDIPITVSATGFHRWTFNSKTTGYTFERITFADEASYLTAYGIDPGDGGLDDDGDNLTNEDEFVLNTDPTNADTDGDGVDDDSDANPLIPQRTVTFSVNMNIQDALGAFMLGTSEVVVDFFDGNVGALGDLALTDGDSDGIYEGSVVIDGVVGASSGGYKFKILGAPDLYEEAIENRTFTLADGTATQVLPTVFFNNVETAGGYSNWADTNVGGAGASEDTDGDGVPNGVEYFMGETGSTFTPNPSVVSGAVTWPKDPEYVGTYTVQTSTDLQNWTDVTSTEAGDGSSVSYTLPTGQARIFVRLCAIPTVN